MSRWSMSLPRSPTGTAWRNRHYRAWPAWRGGPRPSPHHRLRCATPVRRCGPAAPWPARCGSAVPCATGGPRPGRCAGTALGQILPGILISRVSVDSRIVIGSDIGFVGATSGATTSSRSCSSSVAPDSPGDDDAEPAVPTTAATEGVGRRCQRSPVDRDVWCRVNCCHSEDGLIALSGTGAEAVALPGRQVVVGGRLGAPGTLWPAQRRILVQPRDDDRLVHLGRRPRFEVVGTGEQIPPADASPISRR